MRSIGRDRLRRLRRTVPSRDPAVSVAARWDRHPRAGLAIVTALAGALGGWSGGPVAALVVAVDVAVVAMMLRGRRRSAAQVRATDDALDAIARCADELRAGADPATATAIARIGATGVAGSGPERLLDRTAAALRVAEITGAPLADLLDRLESDARGTLRLRRAAMAQAAGAQATGWLLAALPVAGIALGFGIGVDPLHVLLHTRLGAAFSVLALALQLAGLGWTRRLSASLLGAA